MTLPRVLTDFLKAAEDAGITMRDVACVTGVSEATVRNWAHGRSSPPPLALIALRNVTPKLSIFVEAGRLPVKAEGFSYKERVRRRRKILEELFNPYTTPETRTCDDPAEPS